jgi:hypothetical protein
MMALAFTTKKAAKEALTLKGTLGPENIIETSFFGSEYRDGSHGVVVSTAPDRIRNSFATIVIRDGRIVSVK